MIVACCSNLTKHKTIFAFNSGVATNATVERTANHSRQLLQIFLSILFAACSSYCFRCCFCYRY